LGSAETARGESDAFHEALYSAPHSQLVAMTPQPGEEIGLDRQDDGDQFIRVEAGQGEAVLDGERHALSDGMVVVIPAGAEHNVVISSPFASTRSTRRRSTPDGPIHRTKPEAEAYERGRHG